MNSKTCLDLSGLTVYDKKIKDFIANKNRDVENKLSSHSNNKSNPHNVTKAQIGLGLDIYFAMNKITAEQYSELTLLAEESYVEKEDGQPETDLSSDSL